MPPMKRTGNTSVGRETPTKKLKKATRPPTKRSGNIIVGETPTKKLKANAASPYTTAEKPIANAAAQEQLRLSFDNDAYPFIVQINGSDHQFYGTPGNASRERFSYKFYPKTKTNNN